MPLAIPAHKQAFEDSKPGQFAIKDDQQPQQSPAQKVIEAVDMCLDAYDMPKISDVMAAVQMSDAERLSKFLQQYNEQIAMINRRGF